MNVLVVVPAYNEADCIVDVVSSITSAGYPCVVVNDASRDSTAALAAAAGAAVVDLPINLGVGGALRTGWRYAVEHGFERVVQIDADGQHPPGHVAELLRAMDERDLDLVVGSRFADGGSHDGVSRMRRSSMRLLSTILRRFAGIQLSDPTSGFRAIRQPLLAQFAADFPPHYLGDTFEAMLVAGRRGYAVGEIAVPMRARQGGEPSADLFASIRSMIRALVVLVTGASFDVQPKSASKR